MSEIVLHAVVVVNLPLNPKMCWKSATQSEHASVYRRLVTPKVFGSAFTYHPSHNLERVGRLPLTFGAAFAMESLDADCHSERTFTHFGLAHVAAALH